MANLFDLLSPLQHLQPTCSAGNQPQSPINFGSFPREKRDTRSQLGFLPYTPTFHYKKVVHFSYMGVGFLLSRKRRRKKNWIVLFGRKKREKPFGSLVCFRQEKRREKGFFGLYIFISSSYFCCFLFLFWIWCTNIDKWIEIFHYFWMDLSS